jgi:hypothetical protein
MNPNKPIGGKLGSDKTRSQKARSNQAEKDYAEKLGGKRRPASGAIDGCKGDIILDRFLLDLKQTVHGSIHLLRSDLVKIDREAFGENKFPGIICEFAKMADGVPNSWVCVPFDVFVEMLRQEMDKKL